MSSYLYIGLQRYTKVHKVHILCLDHCVPLQRGTQGHGLKGYVVSPVDRFPHTT